LVTWTSGGSDGSLKGAVEVVTDEKDALPALLEGMQHTEKLGQKKGKKLVFISDVFFLAQNSRSCCP
jgi:hypothetical protein